ncbi:membrane fusion protein (multidrug efflux system) [Rhodopseudomonas rhenobacensis]|uniref:Membrane fusion protein (Multidrug efflux system) n=1 Tax=Rhodopseudomonas rhenobacensis TaxID=87461 RepID=A0A7W7Z2M2_9BRAD|nr:efflux RND transporter periplasmic adaptor subunit [Rhodopseudomonas rhenobacensis]MBB5046650.1 membrane fusion protein (multidrug efflux system) [Rhodopseudomonas rhenobacensis]
MNQLSRFAFTVVLIAAATSSNAQQSPPPSPPAVGVARAERKPITESSEFLGRVQAVSRVEIQPRVTAFLTKRAFTEGAEVKQGDLLYLLEQDPFKADVQARQASVAQFEAQLKNAELALNRAEQLLKTSAGTVATADNAQAAQLSTQAQVAAAQAQLRQSEINLAYTEIRSPIDGKIGRTSVTEGNVVSPSSGTLTTVVSQDPMYVLFPVPTRTALEVREKLAQSEGFDALKVRIRLPNGDIYQQTGKLDFINNSVTGNTDTLQLRAVIPNPAMAPEQANREAHRALVDAELVTVLLEGAEPISRLTIPRAALLTDQGGDYVFVVDKDNKATRRGITLDPSATPALAVVADGLQDGEQVIVEGLQRVRNGAVVSPAAMTPSPTTVGQK